MNKEQMDFYRYIIAITAAIIVLGMIGSCIVIDDKIDPKNCTNIQGK